MSYITDKNAINVRFITHYSASLYDGTQLHIKAPKSAFLYPFKYKKMKIKIDYPVNGQDLSVYIVGDIVGISREMHDLELWEVVAKLGNVEVFSYDGEQHGLLANTEIAEDIMQTAQTLLVEEKFYDKV